jgi:effector-binding domain-containing protein
MEQTYRRMFAWIKQQGFNAGNESFEFYLNEPGKTKREDLETIVLIPLR